MRRLPRLVTPLILLAGTITWAATPSVTAIRPAGAQRGTEVEVTFAGARLGDAQEILFFQPGIETISLEKLDDNSVKARLRIHEDAPLGLHDLRVRTATGLSELRTFSVGALPEITEQEPNNDFGSPQAIPLGVVVNGVAENEDVDYFAVEARKGERITAEVEGIRLGITLFDPFVAILDSERFELSSSDDAALVWQDGTASIVAPEDGTYIIQVRESAYAGNGECLYRLHVGRFPRPRAVYPAGGPMGETLEVTWIGDVAGDTTAPVTLPNAPDEDYGILAQDEHGVAPTPNAFRISPFGNVLEVEPNDDHASATPSSPPIALNGVIQHEGDTDFFSFQATKGQVLDIEVFARRLRSPLDSVLHVARKGGNYIAGADDSVGPDSKLRFTAPEDGDYVVYLHDHLKKGSPAHVYRIEITPVAPRLVMGIPNESMRRGTGAQVVEVPRGNRQSILVTATRVDFGGDLNLAAENLPEGLVMEADSMPAGQGVFPVLFTATAEAPLGGSLAVIAGAHVDPNVQVPSTFRQTSELVLGANNVPFWNRSVDRFAAAVTEQSPFSINIVEPQVPLVRNGTMELKVVATRQEGFTAPIALRLPWLPPGVGASGSIVIAEGQNEALIPMNANGNAELRTWKIVVDGTAATATGPLRVSSQLAKLEIAEPFVALGFQPATVEQGKSVDFLVNVTKLRDFPGEAVVELIGLPNAATTQARSITPDDAQVIFPISTTDQTPDGKHANLFCRVVVTMNGEPIVHNLGSGEIRVDKPLVPQAEVAATAAPMPEPQPEGPVEPPLSPLEKLRKEAAERARSAAAENPRD